MRPIELTGRKITVIVLSVIGAIVAIAGFNGAVGSNDDQNWQVVQSVSGNVAIRDKPGYYLKWYADVWTWPRADQIKIGQNEGEGEGAAAMDFDKVRVTFNDGGTADCVVTVRFQYPTTTDERREIHREFNGMPDNVKMAIYNHVVNVIKATGPLMTSSEHQSARKGEFTQLVQDQSQNGIYGMSTIERTIDLGAPAPVLDEQGNPIDGSVQTAEQQTILATEIIRNDDGSPVIAQESPLDRYGIRITQLSITDVEYDNQTLQQFAAKKEAFLRAEQAKAERQNETEQTLMVIQRGLRELAEVEAEANKKKAEQVIDAQREAEVALQIKEKNETDAQTRLEVARLEAQTAQAEAEGRLRVAEFDKQASEQEAEAIRILAAAEEEKIAKAGAITEEQRVLAQIAADRDVNIAQYLAQIRTPSTVIFGGGTGGAGSGDGGLQNNLTNLLLLQATGALPNASLQQRNAEEDVEQPRPPLAPNRN